MCSYSWPAAWRLCERTRGGGEQHRGEGPKDAVGSPDELRLSLGIQPVDIELTHPGDIPYLKRVCMYVFRYECILKCKFKYTEDNIQNVCCHVLYIHMYVCVYGSNHKCLQHVCVLYCTVYIWKYCHLQVANYDIIPLIYSQVRRPHCVEELHQVSHHAPVQHSVAIHSRHQRYPLRRPYQFSARYIWPTARKYILVMTPQ